MHWVQAVGTANRARTPQTMNILVVDHSRVFRILWEKTARASDLESILVANGAQGLAALRQQPVSLICVSLVLTDMDGIDFCRQARSMAAGRDVPIILLTSSEQQSIRQRAFDFGVTEVHAKYDIGALFTEATRIAREHARVSAGRVLYVEDDPVGAGTMLDILHGMHLHVDHHDDAAAAFEAFRREDYDLVVCDTALEGRMNGFGLVSRLHARATDNRWIPVLAISDRESVTRQGKLVSLGVSDFLTRPLIEHEVRARVGNLVTHKQLFERARQQQHSLYELAMTDQLTGLYNRNALSEFVSKACAEANRHEQPLSVVVLDIDQFKRINDDHGHQAGDEVLVAVADLLAHSCRKEDFAVRLAGGELLLVLTHCNRGDARRRAEQLRERIAELRPGGIDVSASFGVAERPHGEHVDLDGLLRAADAALSEAKAAGRDRVVEHGGLHAEGRRHVV